MEIGISSEQLIEIGLNMAGFLASGLLVIVLHSIFRKKDGAPVVRTAGEGVPNPSAKKQFKAESATKIEPEVEFINLKGVAWKPKKTDGKVPGNLKDAAHRKQEVIRMANKLILSNHGRGDGSHKVEEHAGERATTGGNIELQTTGRIK